MILQSSQITKSFFQGTKEVSVLKDISFSVSQGETVAILGRSGSGKSTLLSLLSGLDRPDSGKLELLNTDILKLSEEESTRFRAKHMGIVFQNFHLLPHLTAIENVRLPLEILKAGYSQSRADQLLSAVGLSDRPDHRPSQLSGGERQRVAVARALVTEPDILLADEPSGSLDEETGETVMSLLFDLINKENRAMILVTHDQDLAQRCSRRLLLEHGVLRELD
ncbi:MAG: ABC transporter ATP-binding protein [Bdellovibrionales bacterium]|nr:ABC transporter ATP-binding protein [Bdellovibrionales bacterium]